MLYLELGVTEYWDDEQEKFRRSEPIRIVKMEHSLWSMAQWETKYRIPFAKKDTRLEGEAYLDYINFMIVEGEPIKSFNEMSQENINQINEYINGSWTATSIRSEGPSGNPESYTTTEQYYASMVVGSIPWEAQYWNITRLQTLMYIVKDLTSEKKKKTRSEILAENAELNRQRRAAMNSKG